MQNWNALDSPETFSMMISKFPRLIRDRWYRKVLKLRKRHQKKSTLLDLSYFLFSNSAVDKYLKKSVKPAKRSLKMNLTGANEDGNQKKQCQICQKIHDLDACFKYN